VTYRYIVYHRDRFIACIHARNAADAVALACMKTGSQYPPEECSAKPFEFRRDRRERER
jgi:hypothetical protein